MLVVLLFAPPALATADVMLGRLGPQGSWNPATQFPLSDHVHFRVNVPQSASSGEFTLTHPDSPVEHLSGTFSMVNGQKVFTSGLAFTGYSLDGTWSVQCDVTVGGGSATFGPTPFQVRNLTVEVPGGDTDPVFLVLAQAGSVGLPVSLHDGYEVLPSGANPSEWVADVTAKLVPLWDGTQANGTVSQAIAEDTSVTVTLNSVQPGFYYKDAFVQERMLAGPSGGPDNATAYSTTLTITSATRDGFVYTGTRQGYATVHLHTSGTPAWVQPADSLGRVRRPDGTSEWAGIGVPTSLDQTVGTSILSFPLAGAYDYGLTLKDAGGNMHDGLAKWAVPRTAQLVVPAADYFVQYAPQYDTGGWASGSGPAWAMLGCVQERTSNRITFYSACPQEGVRGGIVLGPTKAVFEAALQDDQVMYHMAHGNEFGVYAGTYWVPDDPGPPPVPGHPHTDDMNTTDLLALPRGCADQMRLFYLHACHGWDPPTDAPSFCLALANYCGVQAVVGFEGGAYWDAPAQVLDDRLWSYWTLGFTIRQGVKLALRDMRRDFPDEKWVRRIRVRGDSCLAPAWQ